VGRNYRQGKEKTADRGNIVNRKGAEGGKGPIKKIASYTLKNSRRGATRRREATSLNHQSHIEAKTKKKT